MASREMIWLRAKTLPWQRILIEAALLGLFVLSSTHLLRR